MKIKILLAQTIGKIPNAEIKYTNIESFEEAQSIQKNSIDKSTYFAIKALEKNQDFVNKVKEIREENDIPEEGFTYDEWNRCKKMDDTVYDSQWKVNLEKESINRLTNININVNVPDILRNSLADIVNLNTVFIPLPQIYVQRPYVLLPNLSYNSVKIVINNYLSKTKLKELIGDIYDTEIKPAMDLMKSKKTQKIHNLAEEVMKLLEQGIRYAEIVKEFEKRKIFITDATLRKVVSDSKKKLISNSKK